MDYLQVLGLALLPALGNFFGATIAEVIQPTPRMLSRALHAAAGIVVAVVAVELIPTALAGTAAWIVVLGFCLGGVAYILLQFALEKLTGGDENAGPWMVYAAVFIDLTSDGLMIGVGSVVSFTLALVLAVGQVTADIPEGFATIANLRDKGVSRPKRLMLAASFVIATLLGATMGYWLLRDQADALKLSALAFTAGLLVVAGVEDMLGEAHEAADDTRLSAGFFVGGFALFTLVASYFEAQ